MNPLRLSKVALLVVLVIGVAIVGWGLQYIGALQSKSSQTVHLSNGKSVAIGQAATAFIAAMGGEVSLSSSGVYRYPADTSAPVQLNVYVDRGKVAAILLGRNADNYQEKNRINIGMTGTALSRLFGGSLEAINTKADFVQHRGYKVSRSGVVSYYLTQTCSPINGDNIEYLAVVKPGAEKLVKFLNRPLTCTTGSK